PRNTVTFPSPPDLGWEEVTIRFVSDTAVQIRAGDVSRDYTFAEAGFKDGRSAEKPDKLWLLLRVFARVDGELTREMLQKLAENPGRPPAPVKKLAENIGRAPAAVKTAVKELRKRLCALVGIDDDPFHPYWKVKAYKVKFTLLDHGNYAPARQDE